ncbi:MAG TPA: N-acetyltransferase family protein [Fimbriimonadaceae bacterium]|nr:N-acetyltransferase family protein [Fimbriimonadaceae bacterium]
MLVRPTIESDLPGIREILEWEILNNVAHFGLNAPDLAEIANEWSRASGRFPWFTALDDGGRAIGFAKAGTWKPREAYNRTCEIGIYVRPDVQSCGLGTRLYSELIPACDAHEFHLLVAGIRLPNDPCVRLHEKFGFRKVAHFNEMGYKFGEWHDVGYWQRGPAERGANPLPISPTK